MSMISKIKKIISTILTVMVVTLVLSGMVPRILGNLYERVPVWLWGVGILLLCYALLIAHMCTARGERRH